MLETKSLSKSFEQIKAVNNVSLSIRPAQIFGLLGTNGAGKSTLLRMLAGIIRPDSGKINLDGKPIWEQPSLKQRIFYISDEQFHFPNSTPRDIAAFYAHQYPDFETARFFSLLEKFSLDATRRINTFSKGMKKQLDLLCALSSGADYILCDETFDGLDPAVRYGVKSLFADRMSTQSLTTIIASHNLRELEDIRDTVGLLHKGGLLLERDLSDIKRQVHKVQAVFEQELDSSKLPLDIVSIKQSGRVYNIIARGGENDVAATLAGLQPIFMEMLPLTLEEIFISETEVVGYDFKNLTL